VIVFFKELRLGEDEQQPLGPLGKVMKNFD
jgi:hypothetical protein